MSGTKAGKLLGWLRRIVPLLVLITQQFASAQTSYFIDAVNGSDANSGRSESLAWKTISKVNRSVFLPGEKVLFRRSQSWRENLVIPSSGAAGNHIIFGSYGLGAKPIINGSVVSMGWALNSAAIYQAVFANPPRVVVEDNTLLTYVDFDTDVATTFSGATAGCFAVNGDTAFVWARDGADPDTHTMQVAYASNENTGAGILIQGRSYVTIDGLTVCNTAYRGVDVELSTTPASNVVIKNCTVFNAGDVGINLQGADAAKVLSSCTVTYDTVYQSRIHGIILTYQVTKSTISHNLVYNNSWNLPLRYHGISSWAANNTAYPDSNTFEYNTIYGTCSMLPASTLEGTGIQMDDYTHNSIVQYNTAYNNAGAGFVIYKSTNNTIRYNVAYHNGKGFWSGDTNATGNVYNNTFFGNIGSGIDLQSTHGVMNIKNNIIAQNGNPEIDIFTTGVTKKDTSDYNLVYHSAGGNFIWWGGFVPRTWAGYLSASGLDAHSVNADPLFTDTAAHDFRLRSGSPAINAGTSLGYTRDLGGNSIDSIPDIGAYERTGALGQNPRYQVSLLNYAVSSATTYEFDMDLVRMGETTFELATLQSILTYNTAITAGTISLSMVSGSSELNDTQKPTGFSVAGNELRIAAKTPPGSGNGTVIGVTPGVRVGRFRLTSSVPFVMTEKPNIAWKNASDPYTKVNAYVGGLNTEITDASGYSNSLDNIVLSVTLTSFTAQVGVSGQGVQLEWKTASEVNNYGYTVQRKLESDAGFADLANAFIAGKGTTVEPQTYSYVDKSIAKAGSYSYRLKQQDLDGTVHYTQSVIVNVTVLDVAEVAPKVFQLMQNYPNPFNPTTSIRYEVPNKTFVTVELFDAIGRFVRALVNEEKERGSYLASLDAGRLASGLYYYRMQAGSYVATRPCILLK